MSTATYHFEIEFPGYWHAGTGEAGPGDLDAVVLRDASRIPYFPGKALKGLFHEAFCELVAEAEAAAKKGGTASGAPSRDQLPHLFGTPGNRSTALQSRLRFSNAALPPAEHAAIVAAGCQDGLTQAIASTALEDGIASNRTLRRIEVAIPMTLRFSVAFHDDGSTGTGEETEPLPTPDQVRAWLEQAAGRIRMAGAHRHNGLGECRVRRIDAPAEQPAEVASGPGTSEPAIHEDGDLIRIPFAIETLEPVILGETAATTGAHESLDFLTGAALLGAFARDCYPEIAALGGDAAFRVFHSGDVRFGDAHPVSKSGHAAWPVPASWHFKKGAKLFVGEQGEPRHLVTTELKDLARSERGTDDKQARGQWIAGNGAELTVDKRQHLKSARDSAAFGRPEPSQLFAYQSIEKGRRFAGEIRIRRDNVPDTAIESIKDWIATRPVIRIGRSKTAEFGSCRVEPLDTPLPAPPASPPKYGILIYALSDLCPAGTEILPTDGKEWHGCLGGWSLDPARTHIRVREYARWNGFRGWPDPAARVITRGSVIAFIPRDGAEADPAEIQQALDCDGLGLHLQHGLGRVLVNPDFAALDANPLPAVRPPVKASTAGEAGAAETPLVALARKRHSHRTLETKADDIANELENRWKKYAPQPSPSQWSRLRHLTAGSRDFEGFLGRAVKVFDHGASRRVWERAVSGSGTLLAELLVNLPPLAKKEKDGNEPDEPERKDQPPPAVAPPLIDRAKKQPSPDRERLVLLAVAEACRRLRQEKRDR